MYKKTAKYVALVHITPKPSHIMAYGGTTLPVVGTALLQVWRGEFICRLECKVVDRTDIRQLLGRKACIGMKIVIYLNNDELKPDTGHSPVYALGHPAPMSTDQLIQKHPQVFSPWPGVGLLEEKYHIKLDPSVSPVQHAPRRVPVPLREVLKSTLDDLVKQEIIAPIQKLTPWISLMVVVPKKNGTLRICLDTQDLNKAIRREHYTLPTNKDVATQ